VTMFEEDICRNCGADLRGAEIPREQQAEYEGRTHFSRLIGVEYTLDHPHHYDGVSEWRCPDCGIRVGRWSGAVLTEGQFEPRYGGKR
jgi:hypothetical protein